MHIAVTLFVVGKLLLECEAQERELRIVSVDGNGLLDYLLVQTISKGLCLGLNAVGRGRVDGHG